MKERRWKLFSNTQEHHRNVLHLTKNGIVATRERRSTSDSYYVANGIVTPKRRSMSDYYVRDIITVPWPWWKDKT